MEAVRKRIEGRILPGHEETYHCIFEVFYFYCISEVLTELCKQQIFKLHSVTMSRPKSFAKIYKSLLAQLMFSTARQIPASTCPVAQNRLAKQK